MMEPSKDVMELLKTLADYMADQGLMLCEQSPSHGLWDASNITLGDLYQDYIDALNTRLKEAAREAAGNG